MNLKVQVLAPVFAGLLLLILIITLAFLLYYKIKRRRNKQHHVCLSESPFIDSKWKTYVQLDIEEKASQSTHGFQKEKKRNGQYIPLPASNYFDDVYDSPGELDDSEYHSESDACDKAKKKDGNFLRTSKGKVYTSTPDSIHVVIQFIKDKPLPSNNTELWIKKSPCSSCSSRLLDLYKFSPKPTLYIGAISRPHHSDDDKGLIQLLKEGFNIKVWDPLVDENDCDVNEYINNLKKTM
ncbi:PREDICTED: uncharacterized protein LOC109580418 [Amphimedon queenslandica]|uniref:Uncharacterized protein n=1 Tax=Amphimedon queenslandica TaxID=400682 RepID=A0A1X7VWN1_AMPQE|nr:PREDICTED: uncharacterized protein LOC109580418 [Amphimedon queenslandica]|eukprot:XP_019849090.1 PREDICTED: uncharacterized protein LOC109580418 [Amphimedon queenslandica]